MKFWKPVYAQLDLKDCVVKLKDGSSPQNELTIVIGEGNVTWTENKARQYTLDRGALDEVRDGDEAPFEVSLSFTWKYLTSPASASSSGGGTPTIEDVLKNRGCASDWASSDPDACRPFAIDIEITYAPSPSTCGDMEIMTLPDFRYESLAHDLRAGTVTCNGKCNAIEPIIVRQANS